MKAIDRPFFNIINGTTQFIIPVFQRDYRWTEQQCEQLWRDILLAAASGRRHFLGSVVYVATDDLAASFTRWVLIDGQQRMTTLTLLLTALRDHIQESGWVGTEEGPTAKRVEAYFLKNVQEEGRREHKLVLRRHDQETLAALLDGQELPTQCSERIRDNYQFFRQELAAADPEFVYAGIGQLVLVDVTLDRGTDDPQLIFESLNSTGLELSQSDLIRNFMLMRIPERDQTRLYETYWSKIEGLFRTSESTFDSFIRDYIALEAQASKQERADQLYFAFRRVFGTAESNVQRLEDFLGRLLRFARYHAAFSVDVGAPEELREPLARLRRLTDQIGPLVMRLFDCHQENKTLDSAGFAKTLELLESYVFRRAILGEQARNYWQVFTTLAHGLDINQAPLDVKVGLARQGYSYRFPDDEEFQRALEEGNLYGKRVCRDLLERLENFDSKERTDTSGYSIEHVMPQNESLSVEWRTMLGSNWQEVQRLWLHRLGNLTLTGYNSSYSDRPFFEKKTISGGFNGSSVRLNRYIREQGQWTDAKMKRRGKDLATRAVEIWPRLHVEQEFIAAAQTSEMRELAKRRDVGKVAMTDRARELFEELRPEILSIDTEIIELAEDKSVSYHGPAFFVEVIPRVHGFSLLLPLAFNEVADYGSIAEDTAQWKFIVNAAYDGGVLVSVSDSDGVKAALPLIRHAHAVDS